MNGWALTGVALLWAASVAALIILIRRWRIVEEAPLEKIRESKERALADARENLRKGRAKMPKKAGPSLEILGALAQDEKLMAGQIRKWLSEKEDGKTKK